MRIVMVPLMGILLTSLASYYRYYPGFSRLSYRDDRKVWRLFCATTGWDYWMGRTKFANGEYLDPKFNVNGIVKTIEGNVTQIITDTTYRLVSEIDTPFLCVLDTRRLINQPLPCLQVKGFMLLRRCRFRQTFPI